MKKLFTLGPQHHGHGNVTFAWKPDGLYAASVGEGQRNLFLFDRRGAQVDEVQLKSTGKVLQLEWDKDGDILAILQQGEPSVLLWRHAEKKLEVLEVNSQDPSFLVWSKTGPQLVVGTGRGNVMIYNKRTLKKQSIMGKHSKKITCGAWHPEENIFVCGSEDKTLTLSSEEGDSILPGGQEDLVPLKNEPGLVQFAGVRSGGSGQKEKMVSMVNGEVHLLLMRLSEPNRPTELAFQARYGTIKGYCWFGDQYLIIGFSLGYVVIISTQTQEIQEELSSVKYHQNTLDCLCCSRAANMIASAGDDGIRLISMNDFKEIRHEHIKIKPEARVTQMHWSEDGELLSFCTEAGWVYCYLAKLAVLSATCSTRLAYLTSLQEMTICDCTSEEGDKIVIPTDVEPSVVGLGPAHLAAAFNNRIWYYSCAKQGGGRLVNEQEYVGTVESVGLNATHACVLIAGRVFLHPIEGTEGKTLIFPRKEGDSPVSCSAIVGNFLITAHTNGKIQYFSLVDGMEVNEYKHETGIRKCFPNQEGTRVAFIDAGGAAWLYNPINDDCTQIPDFPPSADRVLWDVVDSTVFGAADQSTVFSFIYAQVEVGGSAVRCLGKADMGPEGELKVEPAPTPLQGGSPAALLADGAVWCQQAGDQLLQVRLRSHDQLWGQQAGDTPERRKASFCSALALNRFALAFKLGLALHSKECWMAMGRRCLECLDMAWAKKAYRQAPAAGMVLHLERIQTIEDKQLLSGHVASLLGRFQEARQHFLQSCCPEAALDMHCDFLQWDQALSLAQTLAPHRLPETYLRSALQLESKGEQQMALNHFEQAEQGAEPSQTAHVHQCRAGVARTCVRLGEIARGMQAAKELKDPAVCKECAAALQQMRQNDEAAQLYEEAGAYDSAASLYIQEFNFEAVTPLLSKIQAPKLHLAFAKAKESRGAYREALTAYERGRDTDSMARLYIEKLNEPHKAFSIVRDTQSTDAAERVADYCIKQGNNSGAVEFLMLAGMQERAFEIAERSDESMRAFEIALGEEGGNREQHAKIGEYYAQRNHLADAAKHYAICEEYQLALKLYLKCGESQLDRAIEVVGKARNDALTHMLIDYVMGESDGVPKDQFHVYRLHKALGNYIQAAGTALIIARQEQEMGNYKHAHQLLFKTCQDLKSQKLALPQELWRRLMVLHSYVIVRSLVKAGDHYRAARMLLRVAKSIQNFPAHVVPILTSVVIECQRAKLPAESYQYACTLMKPENRPQITEQYKKKIENIVRKPPAQDGEKTQESLAPCMYCGAMLPESQLDCSECKNISPFCIVTGFRMLRDDWSNCPSCNFPAKRTALVALFTNGDACPMCETVCKPGEVQSVPDPSPQITEYRSLFQPLEQA